MKPISIKVMREIVDTAIRCRPLRFRRGALGRVILAYAREEKPPRTKEKIWQWVRDHLHAEERPR